LGLIRYHECVGGPLSRYGVRGNLLAARTRCVGLRGLVEVGVTSTELSDELEGCDGVNMALSMSKVVQI
jgi:hypothetical protein